MLISPFNTLLRVQGIYTQYPLNVAAQLAILEDLRQVPPRAMSFRELDALLAARQDQWHLPTSPTTEEIAAVLRENELLKVAEITSPTYGRKTRYLLGRVSLRKRKSGRKM